MKSIRPSSVNHSIFPIDLSLEVGPAYSATLWMICFLLCLQTPRRLLRICRQGVSQALFDVFPLLLAKVNLHRTVERPFWCARLFKEMRSLRDADATSSTAE